MPINCKQSNKLTYYVKTNYLYFVKIDNRNNKKWQHKNVVTLKRWRIFKTLVRILRSK
jgi:hypothetical protein